MSSSLSYLSRPCGTVPSASHSWRSWCSRFRWPEVSLEDVVVGLGCVCLNVVVFCGVRRRELPRASPSLVSKPWVRNFFSVELPKSPSRRMGSPPSSLELTGNLPRGKGVEYRAAEAADAEVCQSPEGSAQGHRTGTMHTYLTGKSDELEPGTLFLDGVQQWQQKVGGASGSKSPWLRIGGASKKVRREGRERAEEAPHVLEPLAA